MSNQAIARALLAAFCVAQGMATMAIDLNRTHATHPQWPGHARFHVVWQTAAFAWLAVLELLLLLVSGPFGEQRFYLVAILAVIPILGFFTALMARRLFQGTLSDPNGIPPVIIAVRRSKLRIDLNLAAEIFAVLVLASIVALYRQPGSPR